MFRTARLAAATRLNRSILTAGLAAAAGLALIAGPTAAHAKPPAPCRSAACILDVDVQPGGLSLGVSLDTSVNTIAELDVYKGGVLVGRGTDYSGGTAHTVRTGDTLAPNTTYTWHAIVTDGRDKSYERSGEASTLHRRVTVQFSTVTVTNDSDDDGAGEFRGYVGIPGSIAIPPLLPRSINSGETKLLGSVLQQRDAGATTLIHTQLCEDDTWFTAPNPCPTDLSWVHWESDKGPWSETATASGTVNTYAATKGIVPFQITVNSYVGFYVRGYYSVDFVA